MATSRRRGSTWRPVAIMAVMATGLLWLSAPAPATEPGLLKATSKDASLMASIIRGVRTHSSDVRVERQPTTRGGQVIQVMVRARPGAFAKVGVYTLMLLTDRRGKVVLERVSEDKAPQRHYHFGENGLEEIYSFSFDGSSNHQWSIGTTYVAHSRYYSFDWATGRVSGRPVEPHLTLTELEALWKQASAVLKKAVGRAPVSEEEVLHPGYVCNSSSPLTNGCKPEG
jgi:hypothetical protein